MAGGSGLKLFPYWLFVSLAAAGCVTFSLRALSRVRMPERETELLSALLSARSQPEVQRLALERVGNHLGEATAERNPRLVMSWLKEQLREVGFATSMYAGVPVQCGRVSLALGTAASLVSLASAISERHPGVLVAGPLWAFAAGFCGALVCFAVGRRAKIAARERREKWQKLSHRLVS